MSIRWNDYLGVRTPPINKPWFSLIRGWHYTYIYIYYIILYYIILHYIILYYILYYIILYYIIIYYNILSSWYIIGLLNISIIRDMHYVQCIYIYTYIYIVIIWNSSIKPSICGALMNWCPHIWSQPWYTDIPTDSHPPVSSNVAGRWEIHELDAGVQLGKSTLKSIVDFPECHVYTWGYNLPFYFPMRDTVSIMFQLLKWDRRDEIYRYTINDSNQWDTLW